MLEEKLARVQVHRNNIRRYRRLLNTTLTDLERDFILRRLEEEEQAVEALSDRPAPMAGPLIKPSYAGGAAHG